MGARAAFVCARALKLLQPELESYEKARLAACEKHGKLDTTNNHYVFADGAQAKFVAELESLLDIELELNITPISLAVIEDAKISPAELMQLLWLVSE